MKRCYPVWSEFQKLWNESECVRDVALVTGQKVGAAQAFASNMRKAGWEMKVMPTQRSLHYRLLETGRVRFDKTSDCWIWTGTKFPNGYGQIRLPGGVATGTHRASWLVHFGEIPEGMFVCHHCDAKACINPSHLFLGTCKENLEDMYKKDGKAKTGERIVGKQG